MKIVEYILTYFYKKGTNRILTSINSQLCRLCHPNILNSYHSIQVLDERSLGYVAIGLYEESEESVLVIVDESKVRNLAPAITEAFYRKFPIIVLSLTNRSLNNIQYPNDMFGAIGVVDSLMNQEKVDSVLNQLIDLSKTKGGMPVMLCINENGNGNWGVMNNTNILSKPYVIPSTCAHIQKIKKILASLDAPNAIFYVDSYFLCEDILNINVCNRIESNYGIYSNEGLLSIMVGASIVAPSKQFIYVGMSLTVMYDLNVLGNRHINNNICICVVDDSNQYIDTLFQTCKTWGYNTYCYADNLFSQASDGIRIAADKPSLIIIK